MGQALGIVTMAVQLAVDAILVKPKRSIGPFQAHVTLREVGTDELEVTDHPVEQGSQITDHSFMRPSEVVIECMWSNSTPHRGVLGGLLGGAVGGTIAGVSAIFGGNSVDQVRDTYQRLLALQRSRIPFDVFTGKRAYKNMLVKTLVQETDKETENSLRITAHCREVIFAQVRTVTIGAPQTDQEDPESTMPSADKGLKQLGDGARANMSSAIDALTPDPAQLLF